MSENRKSKLSVPVDDDFVDDAVDRWTQYYLVNYYSRLNLYLEYFDCLEHCDVNPMVLDVGLGFDQNDYVHC